MDDFKPNSDRFKEQEEAVKNEARTKEQPVQKVVKGGTKVRKKSFLSELIQPDDVANAKDYIVHDIIIPALKQGAADVLDAILFPNGKGSNRRRKDGGTYVSYSKVLTEGSGRRTNYRESDRDSGTRRVNRRPAEFENVIFDQRGDAISVLDQLEISIEKYGNATVRTFYELVGSPGRHTDCKIGWTDLRGVDIIRKGGGWFITLPDPMVLD